MVFLELRPVNEIFAIIGSPIFHSLSPRLHNAAYRAMNYPALFLPLQVESFEEFWQDVVCSQVLDSARLSAQRDDRSFATQRSCFAHC